MSDTEEMASSMLPMLVNDGFGETSKRADYLSKRVCNFSVREACQLANVTEKSVRRWRAADPNFNHLDTEGMTDLRKALSTQLIDMEYTRNFHLVLQKDFTILYKDATSVPLTEKEYEYLLKIRQHYNAQSLAMVKQLLGGGTVEAPFDFTRLTMTIKREQISITQETQ